jgi:hypothetical protein
MDLAFWRDASIVLLSLEGFILMLIPGALIFFSIKGMRELTRKLKVVSPKVQAVFSQINLTTRQASDRIASPLIAASAAKARVSAMRRGTASLIKQRGV